MGHWKYALAGLASVVTLMGLPTIATAQTPPATIGQQYVPAPWWMREPVIASIGNVRVEITANRAQFGASFQSVDRSVAEASRKAADQVRALSQALAAYGLDRVRVETTLSTRPLYDQYRDENGVLRDNQRADKIERYQADATVRVAVRDVAVLEEVYAIVLNAQPASVDRVYFSLEPENVWVSNLAAEAMKDARRRAEAATENAGARLGSARVIDPTGRACQTDVLAGWPSYSTGGGQATNVEEITVTGARVSADFAGAPPPPPPPPAGGSSEGARLALQPPIQVLTDTACVVYGLN